jgi:hypothetical protein
MRRLWLAVLPALASFAPAPPPAPTFKPVSFAVLEDYDKGEDLAEVTRDFALMRRLGVRTWRGSFGWDDYEPARGRCDFAWLHRFADEAQRHGITLRPYIGYTPEWAAKGGGDGQAWNDPPRRTSDWVRFVSALAREMRRHPNIASYELYNEENVRQWWDGPPAAYHEVLRRGAAAIRREHPGVPVLLGGLVFPDTEWIEQACAARAVARSFDVLPLHAYPETWTPAGVTAENYLDGLPAFTRAADAACGRKPVWINEAGFATTPGRSERDQARWWVRAVASWLAQPRVEHIGIYEIKDLRPDRPAIGDAPNYHLGLTRADRTAKLAFATVDMLTDLLDTGRLAVADEAAAVAVLEGGAVPHHVFVRPDGDCVLFLWSRDAPATVRVTLAEAAAPVTEYALDGTPRPAAGFDVAPLRLDAGEPRTYRFRCSRGQ